MLFLPLMIDDANILSDLITISDIMVMLQIDDHLFLIADPPPAIARLHELAARDLGWIKRMLMPLFGAE